MKFRAFSKGTECSHIQQNIEGVTLILLGGIEAYMVKSLICKMVSKRVKDYDRIVMSTTYLSKHWQLGIF